MRREANLWRGAIYRRFPMKVASSPSCAANPPGLVRVIYWLCRQGCFWLCCQGYFLAVSPGLFLAVLPGFLLAVLPGLLLAVTPGLFSDSVVRNFVSGFGSWLSWLCDQGIVQSVTTNYRAAQLLREPVKVPILVPGVRYQVYECTGQESLRLKGKSRPFSKFPYNILSIFNNVQERCFHSMTSPSKHGDAH